MKTMREFVRQPQNLFVLMATFFGVLLVFLVPPMQAPDEHAHLYQAYGLSNFQLLPSKFDQNGRTNYGFEIPRTLSAAAEDFKKSVAAKPDAVFDTRLIDQYMSQPLRPEDAQYHTGVSLYPPIVYLPQAIAISIAKPFNASPPIIIWLARLANLAVWIALIYLAIRLLPFAKWGLVVLALNPVAVFLSASLSADVMTTGLSFLFFSLVASQFVRKDAISYRWCALLLVVVGLLALTKPVNILFALLLFAIPWKRFKNIWRYALFCVGGFVLVMALAFSWNKITSEASVAVSQISRPDVAIVPSEQLAGIIHHPLGYAKILVTNYIIVPSGYPGDTVLRSFFGTFGWFDTQMPLWAIVVYCVGLLVALLFQFGRELTVSKRQKVLLGGTALLLVLANITAMYAFFTPLGSGVIDGVQGRYFIPASVLIVGLFTARKKLLAMSDKTIFSIITITTVVSLSAALASIFYRYYV